MLTKFIVQKRQKPYPEWAQEQIKDHSLLNNFTILKKRTIIGDDKLIVRQYGRLVEVKIHSGEVYLYLHSSHTEAKRHIKSMRDE